MERKKLIVQALGRRIASLRKAKKFTQLELSARLDMDEGHIRRVERGKRYPSLQLLCAITEELGITMEELFEGIE